MLINAKLTATSLAIDTYYVVTDRIYRTPSPESGVEMLNKRVWISKGDPGSGRGHGQATKVAHLTLLSRTQAQIRRMPQIPQDIKIRHTK